MKPDFLKVSVLFGAGAEDPELTKILMNMGNLKVLKQALDPETFLKQHQEITPDLVLVDLNGLSRVPDWLERVVNQMPRSEIVVCSQSRDPDFLIRIMKLRIGAFIPLPVSQKDLEDAVEMARAELARQPAGEPQKSQIVAVTGTKGGVGTTSIATNLAVALAELMPGGVILVDLARPFPQTGQFLDLKASHTIMDLVQSVDKLDPMFVQKIAQRHKSTLEVLLSSTDYDLDSGSSIDALSLKKIFATLRTSYQWIVVDSGVWLDSVYFSVLKEADHILMVTELTVPDLQNLHKIKALIRMWDIDDHKVKAVVNRYDKDYTLNLRDLENIFAQPAFTTLPSDFQALIEAINQGLPLGEVAPRSKLWRQLKKLARELVTLSQRKHDEALSGKRGLLRRLFS